MIKKCTSYLKNHKVIFGKTGVDKKLTMLLIIQTLILLLGYVYIVYNANERTYEQCRFSIQQINSMVLTQAQEKIRTLETVTSNLTLKHNLGYYSSPVLPYLFRDEQSEYHTEVTNNFTKETRLLFTMFPTLSEMYLFGLDREMVAYNTADFASLQMKDIIRSDWFTEAFHSGGKMSIFSGRNGSGNIYGVRELINIRISFQPKGILAAGIAVNDIDSMFYRQRLNEEQEYAVFNKDGRRLFGVGDISEQELEPEKGQAGDYGKDYERNGYLYRVDYNKEQQIYSMVRTPRSSVNLSSSYEIIVILFFFILITVIFFGMIIRSITVPIKELVIASKAFGKGDFSSRMKINETSDLGYLSSSFNQMADKVENLITEVYVKSLAERELEIQMLRNQINPHFLYNTLENMRMTAYTQGFNDLAEMCKLLADVLRYGVSNINAIVTVRQEMEHLNQYIELQQRRLLYAVQITSMIAPEIENCKMIKLLLQPLVENAINHGFQEFRNRQMINIFGYRKDDTIVFEVTDNGSGMEAEKVQLLNEYIQNKNAEFHSIGLKNVNRRIVLSYGKEYGMVIKSKPGRGTSVTITLPIVENEMEENDV